MQIKEPSQNTVSLEIFAAKDSDQIMLSVPLKCGLKNADTIYIKDKHMVAMRNNSILPIDFPELSETIKNTLVGFSRSDRELPVGEFLSVGLVDAYFLKVVIV